MQVTNGGNFDVDASITSPQNKTIYIVKRKPAGQFQWNADVTGVYRLCFGNQFSSITHKTVSFDFHIVDESTPAAYDTSINSVRISSSHLLRFTDIVE